MAAAISSGSPGRRCPRSARYSRCSRMVEVCSRRSRQARPEPGSSATIDWNSATATAPRGRGDLGDLRVEVAALAEQPPRWHRGATRRIRGALRGRRGLHDRGRRGRRLEPHSGTERGLRAQHRRGRHRMVGGPGRRSGAAPDARRRRSGVAAAPPPIQSVSGRVPRCPSRMPWCSPRRCGWRRRRPRRQEARTREALPGRGEEAPAPPVLRTCSGIPVRLRADWVRSAHRSVRSRSSVELRAAPVAEAG
jgi:hypothetical protein